MELSRTFSNPTTAHTLRKLHAHLSERSSWSAREPRSHRVHRAICRRLSPEALDSIVAEYEKGASSRDLAAGYGISKNAVIDLLRSRGVSIRRQPLPPEQVTEAVRLYESGLSLVKVGDALGISPRTIHRTLLAHGVAMRDPHERAR